MTIIDMKDINRIIVKLLYKDDNTEDFISDDKVLSKYISNMARNIKINLEKYTDNIELLKISLESYLNKYLKMYYLDTFNKNIKKTVGVKKVHNYYGMVEQTGSVFLECEKGFFHCSLFSQIFIRNMNLSIAKKGEIGLIQTLSLLQLSYPGHNILTEDLGRIEGVDNCKCGRKGKYFSVLGRVPGTEKRGCSDA